MAKLDKQLQLTPESDTDMHHEYEQAGHGRTTLIIIIHRSSFNFPQHNEFSLYDNDQNFTENYLEFGLLTLQTNWSLWLIWSELTQLIMNKAVK